LSRLNKSFYVRADVVSIARELLGKTLHTCIDGVETSGIISETEAYHEQEKACHAYNGKRTKRTELLFREGGAAYIYLCYGIHHLFNVVTGPPEVAQAVLIRAVLPHAGLNIMLSRRKVQSAKANLSSGPGTLSQALGITTSLNGADLTGKEIWVEDHQLEIHEKQIITGPRIGVDYAGEDALLPWRFYLTGVSGETPFKS